MNKVFLRKDTISSPSLQETLDAKEIIETNLNCAFVIQTLQID